MIVVAVMAVQVLTNLGQVEPGPGLPPGWRLQGVRGARAPAVSVIQPGALRLEADTAVGFAIFDLPAPLEPSPGGTLSWRWRTRTPIEDAALRDRNADDSPIRLIVAFRDGRTIFYSWGNAEAPGAAFTSWTSTSRLVIVLRGARDADGEWRGERRRPFDDYRRGFGRDPSPIVAIGAGSDSDTLRRTTVADISRIEWHGPRD